MWFLFQCLVYSRPYLSECVIVDREKIGELPEVFKSDLHFASGRAGRAGDPGGPMLFEEFSSSNKILYPQDRAIERQWMSPYRVSLAYSAALRGQKADLGVFAIMVDAYASSLRQNMLC
jgi:hypothetical protein